MAFKRVQKKIDWTPEDRARHKAIRETFKDKPSYEELVARGELSEHSMPLGIYLGLRLLIHNLRKMREEAGLSLADLSQKSGMDKAMLSRLETGHVDNPGVETIFRYVNALGKDVEWRFVDAPAGKKKTREHV